MRVLRGMVLGAGIAYLFDPESGRGRRAKLIDRMGRVLREVTRLAGRKTRFTAGQLHGDSSGNRLNGTSRLPP